MEPPWRKRGRSHWVINAAPPSARKSRDLIAGWRSPLARLVTAIYLLTPRSSLWTIKSMNASSGVVRDDKQKLDHDGGLEASVGGLFHLKTPSAASGSQYMHHPHI